MMNAVYDGKPVLEDYDPQEALRSAMAGTEKPDRIGGDNRNTLEQAFEELRKLRSMIEGAKLGGSCSGDTLNLFWKWGEGP